MKCNSKFTFDANDSFNSSCDLYTILFEETMAHKYKCVSDLQLVQQQESEVEKGTMWRLW